MATPTLTAGKQAQCTAAKKTGRILTHPKLNFSSGTQVPAVQISSVSRLESTPVESAWANNLGKTLAEHGGNTFGDLRRTLSLGGGFEIRQHVSERQFEMVMARFSKRIYCRCGAPYILHKDHVACEDFNCVAFLQTGNVNLLRRVWPDRISHTRGE